MEKPKFDDCVEAWRVKIDGDLDCVGWGKVFLGVGTAALAISLILENPVGCTMFEIILIGAVAVELMSTEFSLKRHINEQVEELEWLLNNGDQKDGHYKIILDKNGKYQEHRRLSG